MKKIWKKITIVLIGIALNLAGRWIARFLCLPMWLDMTGTFIASYFTGIWGGIIAGGASNLIISIFNTSSWVYMITSIVAAIMIHHIIKKGYMNSFMQALVSSFWTGILCTIVSTPLNLIINHGYSGNVWGDTLVDMLRWKEVSWIVSALAGEAIVEIVDKQICVIAAYGIIRFLVRFRKYLRSRRVAAASLLLFWILISSVLSPVTAKAEIVQDDFVDTIYNNTNGMFTSEANTICETDDGYLWIGSYAGLTRYDGIEFEFIREGGLVNVVGMMTDSKGRLWIGTNDAGIARYEKGQYTYFTMKDGLPSNSVRCFAQGQDGTVYVGTSDRICRFNADDSVEVLNLGITFVKSMVFYNDMLVVMDNKGCIYAIEDGKKVSVEEKEEDYFFYCIALTSQGLIAGTETGELFVLECFEDGLKIKKRISILANVIDAVFEDSKNRIWVATGTGFGYLDTKLLFHKMSYNGFSSSIEGFHEDYQGNIWIASSRYGVMKLSRSSFINLFEKYGIQDTTVNAVEYYAGVYFFGTDNGLIVFDGDSISTRFHKLVEKTEGCRVRALYSDSEERLWVCTYSGLFCLNKSGVISSYVTADGATSDRFRCITELGDGTMAAGTADGINYISDGRITRTLTSGDGLANTQILSIVEGHDGTVWAGSDGSGIYVISEEGLIKRYQVEDGLSSNIILRIVPHEDGYLIVTSNALCHIDLDGTIRRLNSFPYFNNYDVIIDRETAYITCSSGLYEIGRKELCNDTSAQAKLYGAGDGLLSGLTANSWNYVGADGTIFLCGNEGVISFDGNKLKESTDMKFGLVSMECDGTKIGLDENLLMIPANTKNVSIYASVRNYAFCDAKVRFFVSELEDNPKVYSWDAVEPIHIFKPNLSDYHVYLQIMDSSGETVLQEKMFTVNKEMQEWEKPLYRWYLIIVCMEIFLFTILSVVSMILYVLRKNELEKMQIALENKVNDQTSELMAQQQRVKDLFLQTVTALSEAVDAKDRYTSGHSKRVAEYSRKIAARMGKSKEEQEEIYRAGLLHDVGKIRIPEGIINKAGKLTEEEYNIIKIHPVTGFHILRGISSSSMIAIAAKHHHERYDGKGYPNGLAGDKIPEVARILGVADSYDAMTSYRSYRNALPQEVVKSELKNGKGTQFDPYIADVMLQMMEEDKEYLMRQNDSMQRSILVVDDEPMNHKLISHIMKDEPMYEIVSADSGMEALELLEEKKFDFILLDVRMPGMDGLETLRRIREKYRTPVALMTADKSFDVSMEFIELGCDDYITKPFLPALMKEVVHNMTERTNIED